jgi:hypothetical protein
MSVKWHRADILVLLAAGHVECRPSRRVSAETFGASQSLDGKMCRHWNDVRRSSAGVARRLSAAAWPAAGLECPLRVISVHRRAGMSALPLKADILSVEIDVC